MCVLVWDIIWVLYTIQWIHICTVNKCSDLAMKHQEHDQTSKCVLKVRQKVCLYWEYHLGGKWEQIKETPTLKGVLEWLGNMTKMLQTTGMGVTVEVIGYL